MRLNNRLHTLGYEDDTYRMAEDRWAGPWRPVHSIAAADGTGGRDEYAGTDGEDTYRGRGGDDRIGGGLGHDKLYGNNGDDRIAGGADDDLLDGGYGDDVLSGGAGDDTLRPGFGADVVHGGGGNDYIPPNQDNDGGDTLYGDGGDDVIYGANSDVYGGAGNDEITASGSRVHGGGGDDILNILSAFDKVGEPGEAWGGSGADTFIFDFLPLFGGVFEINDLSNEDVIDLSAIDAILGAGRPGDQAFQIVPEHTGQAGELVVTYDAETDRTSIEFWNTTRDVPDAVIWTPGDHSDFTNFVL